MPAADTDGGASAGAQNPVHPALVLDACCYVNLFASGRIVDIVRDLPYRFGVVDVAQREVTYVRRGGTGEDAQDLVPIEWSALTGAGLIDVLTPTGDAEEAGYVSLLSSLDDGEASTLAVAFNRGLGIATDERKARRLAAARAPHLPLRSTLELIREWCEQRALPDAEIAAVLRNVRERGRFVPPRGDPLTGWWHTHFVPSTRD